MTATVSLDERYLDFCARSGTVFARYARLEPSRLFIFKQLLARRRVETRVQRLKHWLRWLRRRSRTPGALPAAEVIMWVEWRDQRVLDTFLPLYDELVARGVTVRLVSFGGPPNLPPGTIHVRVPARIRRPAWAPDAWAALCEIFAELRAGGLQGVFDRACAQVESLFHELDRILDAVRPRLVIVLSTQLVGGATLVVAARGQGIETVVLQHGILQPLYLPILADRMVTWGRSSSETLLQLGVAPEHLIALGSPAHDRMGAAGSGRARSLVQALGLPDRPTVVFFSNGNDLLRNGSGPATCAFWLEAVAAEWSSSVNVVVRLHPNEDGSLYRACPHLRITKHVPDLATTLDGCDAVASVCSTVLLEGLLYQKPVWQFFADDWPRLADTWERGLAQRVSSRADLGELVQGLAAGRATPPAGKGRIDSVFANHGRATRAVAQFVADRVAQGRTRTGAVALAR